MDPREAQMYHPELRDKSAAYLALRTSVFTRWCFPADQRISWYGSAIRSDGDKGNGMYMTEPQFAAWPDKVQQGDITIGPG